MTNEMIDPQASATVPGAPASASACPECAAKHPALPDAPLYAFGTIDVRFPSLGIEREFQQCERAMSQLWDPAMLRGQRIRHVLEANLHLAARVCYVFHVAGLPAYVLAPAGAYVREQIFDALSRGTTPEHWCVLIGTRAPLATPTTFAGLTAPVALCRQIYSFDFEDWEHALKRTAAPVLESRKIDAAMFGRSARELFERVVHSTDNVGATDAHRALNYLLMRHPGPFLAAAERASRHVLDRIETRPVQGLGTRRVIAVIFHFADVVTGVVEKLACRVDVTEDFPFAADRSDGARAPLGLAPFVENELWNVQP